MRVRDKGLALLHCKRLLENSNLKALKLQCGDVFHCDIDLISTHCKALRCLWLMFGSVRVDLSKLFKSVGSNLEQLCLTTSHDSVLISFDVLSCPVDWIVPSFPKISMYCEKLENIRIETTYETLSTEFVQFCRSYGSQLKSLELVGCSISSTTLRQVIEACSQVSISWQDRFGLISPEELIAMGPRAQRICTPAHGSLNTAQLSLVNKHCVNASQLFLHLNIESRDTLRTLLSPPKLRLREVRIRWHGPEQYSSELFDVLSECVNLRILIYRGAMPCEHALRLFLRRNKRLEEVDINRFGNGGPCRCSVCPAQVGFYDWIPAVKELSKLPSLETLHLCCSNNPVRNVDLFNPAFADVCTVFRFRRNIRVSICGHDYYA